MTDISPTLQALIDAQENPFVLIEPDYHILAANQAYQSAYGLEAMQIVGRFCYELSHRRTEPCHQHGEDCPLQQVLSSGTRCEVLHTHYDQHGSAEHVQIKGFAIPRPGGGFLVGESIFRLATQQDLDCDEMRLIGRSPAFLRAIEQMTLAAASHANILLYGESGVGKELAAHYMHRHSPRSGGPFLAVDCAAISEGLFESEIFGHERGAFTGCVGRKQGLFELANGGTLFLDEVGELSAAMQAKLLRVMESGEFRRVGGSEVLHADVRVIGATNRNLMTMIGSGGFREDLYYRLACITIDLPSLRVRRSDIPALAEALLARINRANGTRLYLAGDALDRLMAYDFPGNVRELRNILQRAAALSAGSGGGGISASAILIDGIRVPGVQQGEAGAKTHAPSSSPPASMRGVERGYIAELLDRFNGHRRTVADTLGISERTLYRKLRRYGLG